MILTLIKLEVPSNKVEFLSEWISLNGIKIWKIFQVGWVKADTKAIQAIHDHVITHNPRVSVSHLDVNTWNLHIKSVTEEDRGNFYNAKNNNFPHKWR